MKEISKLYLCSQGECRMNLEISSITINKFYNKKNKIDFLKDPDWNLGKNTQKTYATKLAKAAEIEILLEKDLCDFNEDDVLTLFESQINTSDSSLQLLFRVSKQYIKWSIGKGIKKTDVNPFDEIKFKTEILALIDRTKLKKYLSEEEIWEIAKVVKNPRDVACIIAVFYGIKGNNSSELIKLKKENVDYINNTIKLITEISIRTIHLPQEIIEIFKNSSEQKIYKRRGKPGYGGKITANFIDSEYVIRPTKINGERFVTEQTIASMCKKNLMEAGYLNISLDDIYNSGKLDLLKHIQQKKGKIEIEDYKNVNGQFGDSVNNYNFLKELYESTISDDKLTVQSKINLWDEFCLQDEIYLKNEFYLSDIDENYMNSVNEEDLYEGEKGGTYVNRYKRSKEARDLCIKKWGAKCKVCGFDFEEVYGEIGKNLIHVHHLNQLSSNGLNHKVNPAEDLRPVCPNCHLILHRRKEPFTINEVNKMIKDNKNIYNNVI